MKKQILASLVVLLALAGCSKNEHSETLTTQSSETAKVEKQKSAKTDIQVGKDYHSLSNPDEMKVTHVSLDLTVDFERKVLAGTAELTLEKIKADVKRLILDTRDLTMTAVTAGDKKVPFSLLEEDPYLGTPLLVSVPKDVNKVTVAYETSPDASGVQWLTPQQTAGKQHPFLFTQAQAIHARSFIPLQDTPKARVTYDAVIRTPKELLAVMSAANDPDTERDGVYEFNMPQPIPSYLIALAVGDLQFQSMGERTGVYAEASWLARAAAEFEDTENMLIETEKRYGEYSWGRYDLLILPPSFPFGGMENPRLSFITPTVIAGDKSLVALIAHELAHSWSGNTITNATWRDLWLNEGFTTYLTYRIMEFIYGTDRYNMELVLGAQDLAADIAELPEKDQILAIDLRGRDADDVFSNIPYEKGALFLRELEDKIGRDNFDQFLLNYFEHFAFQSITTEQFITYLDETLLAQYPQQLDKARILKWIFEPGIPAGAPTASSDAFTVVDNAHKAWLSGEEKAADINTANWNYHQWKYFVDNLPETMTVEQMSELDAVFNFTGYQNNEIAHSWLLHAINNDYKVAWDRLYDYLTTIGRNKLVKPLYAALSKTPEGKAFAKKAFDVAKVGYHPLTISANEGYVQ
ncbi:M1 family metallopeptidase [Planctobacterium marinum]|uniref:Aminopeptidase N n=1 Tax=Planctobacterium marinum TaxID=1631968 RepID=A0AA48KR92_9ALTE|nr:cold-active zinc metallopeptidase M1 family protein [Planctobacterium marinum]